MNTWRPDGRETTVEVPPSILPDDPSHRRADDRLGSWKAISAYLKRDVSTVQRWEKHEGMPVHRHLHEKRGSVYAYQAELDAWWASRASRLFDQHPSGGVRDAAIQAAMQWLRARRSRTAVAATILIGAGAVAAWLAVSTGRGDGNPLADAEFSTLTEFDGIEQAATISPDGRFAAFLSDRDGAWDVWITQIGTGEFRNLTLGRVGSLLNQEVRSLGFSPDGALVTLWVKSEDPRPAGAINVWAIPALGGQMRHYLPGAAELDWASDGTRIVYHPPAPGDPILLAGSPREAGRQIYVSPPGIHNHYPVWSPDDAYIYFVRGVPPDKMDIWRIAADGFNPQRMTFHDSRVSHPVFLDRRTLLYLATAQDGSGPWVHAMYLGQRGSRRLALGVDRYTSLDATVDGRRIVATVARPRSSLWRASLTQGVIDATTAQRMAIPTAGARSPRFGPGFVLFVAAKGQEDVLWKLADSGAVELWSVPQARIVGGPAISPDGRRVALTVERGERSVLMVMTSEGMDTRVLAEPLDVSGSPAWSPDGRTIAVAALRNGLPRLVSVPLDGDPTVSIVEDYSTDPSWSPDGRFLIFSGAEVGPSFKVKAVTAHGQPFKLPDIRLSRGARRIGVLSSPAGLIVLRGEMGRGDLWRIDLGSGEERRLTDIGRDFAIRDFDVSPDASEVVFERRSDNSDVVLIDRR
ncbi:MAG: DNA-binding protein [Woeseiaceae bacterium]